MAKQSNHNADISNSNKGTNGVIPPFLEGFKSRAQATVANFC